MFGNFGVVFGSIRFNGGLHFVIFYIVLDWCLDWCSISPIKVLGNIQEYRHKVEQFYILWNRVFKIWNSSSKKWNRHLVDESRYTNLQAKAGAKDLTELNSLCKTVLTILKH